MVNPEVTLRCKSGAECGGREADQTFLYINHGCEFVKSDLIWGRDLIWDGNYADILGGEVKKDAVYEIQY